MDFSATSLTMVSPPTQPIRPAPNQMMIGKRSISLIMSWLPKMTKGMLMAKPRISKVMLPLAAAATAITLSRLITRSATRIVRMAAIKPLCLFSPSSSSSSPSLSNCTPIQSSKMPPTLAGLIAQAQAPPGKVTNGSGGPGSISHIVGEAFDIHREPKSSFGFGFGQHHDYSRTNTPRRFYRPVKNSPIAKHRKLFWPTKSGPSARRDHDCPNNLVRCGCHAHLG